MNNPINKLEEECGVTDISLHNASFLINKYGMPSKIELMREGHEQLVKATFKEYGDYIFTGFSWGYGGEGPHGLMKFLRECKFDVHIADIIALDSNNPQRTIWIPHTVDEYLN